MKLNLLTVAIITVVILFVFCILLTITNRYKEKERKNQKASPGTGIHDGELATPEDFRVESLERDDGKYILAQWVNDPWTFKGLKKEGENINSKGSRYYLLTFYDKHDKAIHGQPVKFSPFVYNSSLIDGMVGDSGPVAGISVSRTVGTGLGYRMSKPSSIIKVEHRYHAEGAPALEDPPEKSNIGVGTPVPAQQSLVMCESALPENIDAPVLHCFDYFKFHNEGSFHVETCGPIEGKPNEGSRGNKVSNAKSTRLFLQWFPVDRVDHYIVYGRSGPAEVTQSAYDKKWKVPGASYYIETEALKADVSWSAIVTAVDVNGVESNPSAIYKTF